MSDSATGVIERVQTLLNREEDGGCGCRSTFDGETLVLDAADCPHDGVLEAAPACRATAIDALTERDADAVLTETNGVERAYEDEAAGLLVAAGRFVEAVAFHDERLAAQARQDPLGACREATGRAGAVSDIAAETGLAVLASAVDGYAEALGPAVGPTLSHWRVEPTPPDSRLSEVTDLDTGATVRHYDRPRGPPHYHLVPLEQQLPPEALATLAEAYQRLAGGKLDGGERAPARAVRAVAEGEATEWTEQVRQVLQKHARGFGLLEDIFADPAVTDAFVTAPAPENRLRVTVDGETFVTNLWLTAAGVDALASRFRRESGRSFSRADPTLDATAEVADRRLRVAGVTDPPSEGTAFAFRAQGREVWTLPGLVRNGTVTAAAAALLSVAVERGSAVLVAGPRGAGKTTTLGALLWELPPAVRTVVIEDTPELPVSALQNANRDVQPLLASTDRGLTPTDALRTALRLGDGALAIGEVRGEEAEVLYEAMRVGANSEAVLGTIHGDGAEAVYERVVTDLGVSSSSFGVTDLVVSLERTASGERRVRAIEEVVPGNAGTFRTLYEQTEDGLRPTGCLDRGNSHAVENLTKPDESYAAVRELLASRERLLDALARRGATSGDALTESHTERQR
ncbi:Type IV secretory pathway ATPase VirB11/Archaellum biosynthesis ATPase [Halovenus aranensis]|uniref:Type IV secretory pathway ATPase VirB11/Archaellum biosynthesis ATPase n=1 Tax=Halovenus aranensis TaxID=890420 RepID=A0A1G8YVF0_9EURY|nr:ATPase, T2SS/T4P/T4SS family [Halovenus aranensis]SDK05960.1 Type IV secretory pathway ATPase VirB11/Archaellum biosynthesis ATPase [Halovenus aranensis]